VVLLVLLVLLVMVGMVGMVVMVVMMGPPRPHPPDIVHTYSWMLLIVPVVGAGVGVVHATCPQIQMWVQVQERRKGVVREGEGEA